MKTDFNYWTNEYGDCISNVGGYRDERGSHTAYAIMIDGEYIKSLGSITLAKNYINRFRDEKCQWVGAKQ